MPKPKPDFSIDDLLREVEATLAPEGDGLTTSELAERLGISVAAARARLRILAHQGRLAIVRKRTQRMDGLWTTVRAYKLKEA